MFAPTSPQELRRLLSQGIGPQLHWLPAGVQAERLASVLVGMANSQGGVVLLGIAPRSTEVQGIGDPIESFDLAFQAALLSDPPLVLPMPEVVPFDQRNVLWISVPAGLPHVYNLQGRYLWREGKQTNPLPARRLRQLLLERGVVQFEAQSPPDVTYDDLDPHGVEAYLQALNLPGQDSPQEMLLRRGCLSPGMQPTYAALLLFGRYPQRWLPAATILAARFSGTSFADRFVKQDIRGTLPEQLLQAEGFVRDQMRSVVRLVGLAHQETSEYPLEAVRELLVNAVAHRDYNLQGDCIHLNIYADRVEVHSPGRLPGPVTLDNLLEARFSRNAVIVQVLSDLGFVERLGYGLDRVVKVMRENGLRAPRFEETAGSFRVTLFGAPPVEAGRSLVDLSAYKDMDLNPRQQAALSFLVNFRRITSRDYQELCPDVHPETLRRDLADLVGRGLLIKIGDRKSTYYVLKGR